MMSCCTNERVNRLRYYYIYWLTHSGKLLHVDVGRDKERYAKTRAAREGRKGKLYDEIRSIWSSGQEVKINHVPVSYDYTTALETLRQLQQRGEIWWQQEQRIRAEHPPRERNYYRKVHKRKY